MPADHSADVVILGGGPAGLAAAWRVARTGRSAILLERAAAVGGMAASFEVGGMRVDRGSHRLHPATEPDLLADLRGLLGEDLQTRPRHGRLSLYGRWVGFPLRAGELLRAVPPGAALRIARDVSSTPITKVRRRGWSPYREPGSYGDALERSLGPELYSAIHEPFARKLWGISGDEIDVEQARRRVTADTPWKVAARLLRRRLSSTSGAGGQGRIFFYPRRGFGQIVDVLADAAVSAGAQISTSAEVASVVTRGGRPMVVDAGGTTYDAGRVFSTLPLPVLARITRPLPSQTLLDEASTLKFRAVVLVYVVHSGGRWTEYDAHYLPDRDTPVTRISEPANYRVSSDDPQDRSVVCAEIPCEVGDHIWRSPDADLAEVVLDTARRHRLPELRVSDVVVRRMPHVYPVYRIGYATPLAAVDTWAHGLAGVTTFGRLGLFAHDNTHHALAMARDAVASLTADGWDERAWSAARERFARHVVED
ncbi:MAG TPA: FAD-dependent oxidoreductase [Mycobacteriales bacterium]|nr:FAD-dependent oxidoreductase [Mycobacteriales bacterium]